MSRPRDDRPRTYAVRYCHEDWNKPVPADNLYRQVRPGIRVSSTDYGYTDVLFAASVLLDEAGEYSSILLLSSEGGEKPSRKLLEAVREQIDHYLECHGDG